MGGGGGGIKSQRLRRVIGLRNDSAQPLLQHFGVRGRGTGQTRQLSELETLGELRKVFTGIVRKEINGARGREEERNDREL